jgi:hypothetical protein
VHRTDLRCSYRRTLGGTLVTYTATNPAAGACAEHDVIGSFVQGRSEETQREGGVSCDG